MGGCYFEREKLNFIYQEIFMTCFSMICRWKISGRVSWVETAGIFMGLSMVNLLRATLELKMKVKIFSGLCLRKMFAGLSSGLAHKIEMLIMFLLLSQGRVYSLTAEPMPGEMLFKACARYLSDSPYKGELTMERMRGFIELISRHNLERFEFFFRPLSFFEYRVFRKVRSMLPPVVTRVSLPCLKGIFQQGAILSPQEAEFRGTRVRISVTPSLEDNLYGAFGCVFATVGPPDGHKRYGEVVIRLRESAHKMGWATHRSGTTIVVKGRALQDDCEENDRPDAKVAYWERVFFSSRVIAGRDWSRALAWQAVLLLRSSESKNEAVCRAAAERLLVETDNRVFWEVFASMADGSFRYLEAKFPRFVSVDMIESIEVPPERFAEITSWPESAHFLDLIKVNGQH
jgi:hypothetical protein